MKDVDVEKIVEEIRQEIAAKGYKNDIPQFNVVPLECETVKEFDIKLLEEAIAQMEGTWNVAPYHDTDSYFRLIGPLVVLFKKIIRKCIHFHTTPVVLEQNENNRIILDALIQLRNFVKNQAAWYERLDNVEAELSREREKEKTADFTT